MKKSNDKRKYEEVIGVHPDFAKYLRNYRNDKMPTSGLIKASKHLLGRLNKKRNEEEDDEPIFRI